ncbi:Heavy metal-associated isoprenylated plant protein 19 [Glycine max]|nr:Heavy metal-associated isoprenylated plant protein 19 [Glycine max]
MGKNKKVEQQNKVIIVEFKVSMYCNSCERTVAKVISKCKDNSCVTTTLLLGVEKFITDMNEHRVVVTGRIDPMKVFKKLKKKTGKKVEIVSNMDEEPNDESDKLVMMHQFAPENDSCIKTETIMMFSDENPNACVVM